MIALLVVDMVNAFVETDSPLCVAGAKETVPKIKKVVDACRSKGIPIFFIARSYRDDGSDVEVSRWKFWNDNGRPLSLTSTGPNSGEFYGPLKPEKGDYVIMKKKWSAFFRTELDLILRRLGVDTVAITGTQTPNCIRATAYDADMNDFDTVIISDCISSQTSEVQEANIRDFINVGFTVLDSEKFIADLDLYKRGSKKYRVIVDDLWKQRERMIKS
ncbi:MAG: isochorismatase family cysteine hydrolase [Candidatus Micrarchaeia archaeon]